MDSINQTNGGEVNSQNPMGVASGMESKEGGKGAMIGTIIIIVLLVGILLFLFLDFSSVTYSREAIEKILTLEEPSWPAELDREEY